MCWFPYPFLPPEYLEQLEAMGAVVHVPDENWDGKCYLCDNALDLHNAYMYINRSEATTGAYVHIKCVDKKLEEKDDRSLEGSTRST
jgi:hypothetical protein